MHESYFGSIIQNSIVSPSLTSAWPKIFVGSVPGSRYPIHFRDKVSFRDQNKSHGTVQPSPSGDPVRWVHLNEFLLIKIIMSPRMTSLMNVHDWPMAACERNQDAGDSVRPPQPCAYCIFTTNDYIVHRFQHRPLNDRLMITPATICYFTSLRVQNLFTCSNTTWKKASHTSER